MSIEDEERDPCKWQMSFEESYKLEAMRGNIYKRRSPCEHMIYLRLDLITAASQQSYSIRDQSPLRPRNY